jgi:Phage integrase family
MYDKQVKRGKDGLFVRYIGRNPKGTPEKFRLGYDPLVAEERVRLIAAIWREIEERAPDSFKPFWDRHSLEAAKAIAKGLPPTLPRRDYEDPIKYVRRVSEISRATGTHFEPMDPESHQSGLKDLQVQMERARQSLSSSLQVEKATGVTVRQAMETYASSIERSFRQPNGYLKPWGRTRLDQIDSIRSYLSDERFGGRDYLALDLAGLTYSLCDEIYRVFRQRPLTLRSKLQKRMTPSSAKNLIKELGNFFDWLDGAEQYDWTVPRRFHAIKKTPDDLSAAEKYDRRIARENLVIPDDCLRTLFEYALPIERMLLLLGLNCAFAASEIGQLRIGFLKLDEGTIEGIRFKSGNETRHWLWKQTRDGLIWVLSQRKVVKTESSDEQDIVFLTQRGKPIWHPTNKGHVTDGMSNIWYRLVRRVRKDHPEFPSYSFNKLRKTSATRILEIADAETASMILAHKTISEDDLLHHYALLPWNKLYAAQKALEEQLASVLGAGGPDPWAEKPRTYIGLAKTKKVVELRSAGVSASVIAQQLRISVPTVYRLLQVSSEYGS